MGADTTEAGVPTRDGIYGAVPEGLYHADRGSLSVSGAKLLLPPSCPARFKERMDNPPPPKRIFEFGHLVHLEVLGEGVETVEIDADNYRTKAAREARDRARENGKVPVLVGADANDDFYAELGKARAMAAAVHSHPEANALFAGDGRPEMAMYATDPETGVRLRGRADWISSTHIVDVKTSTTSNPDELKRKFWSLGYHLQAAWYRDLAAAIGLGTLGFRFVVIEKEPPYLVTVINYDGEALAEGARLNRQAINLYARCRERNEWPGYTDTTVTLSLPYRALKDRDQAIYNEAADLERNWDDFFSTSDN